MQSKQRIVILGAGLAGLSAAYHLGELGLDYQIFEKEFSSGGLCRSRHRGEFTFDYTGHLIYFKKQYTFELIKRLLNNNLTLHQRSSWIFSKSTYTRYPFQANTHGLPPEIIKECLLGLVEARRANSLEGKDAVNFEDWICKTFGKGIARHFMLPYNRKFWTAEPCKLTCEWFDGYIPVPTLEDTFTGALSDFTKPFGYNHKFWYPLQGGIEELPRAFQREIKEIKTAKEAVSIDINKKTVEFKDGEVVAFDRLISTLPLIEMAGLIGNIPSDITEAAAKLRHTSIFNLNLGVNRGDISDKHWIYFPAEEFVFYRVGFPHNFSEDLAPQGKSSIYVEAAYSKDKPIDKEKITEQIIEGLIKAEILSGEDEIITRDKNDIKYGYIIYDNNHRLATETISGFLGQHQIYPLGRYGSWRYMSMEDVILAGRQIAHDTLLAPRRCR